VWCGGGAPNSVWVLGGAVNFDGVYGGGAVNSDWVLVGVLRFPVNDPLS